MPNSEKSYKNSKKKKQAKKLFLSPLFPNPNNLPPPTIDGFLKILSNLKKTTRPKTSKKDNKNFTTDSKPKSGIPFPKQAKDPSLRLIRRKNWFMTKNWKNGMKNTEMRKMSLKKLRKRKRKVVKEKQLLKKARKLIKKLVLLLPEGVPDFLINLNENL